MRADDSELGNRAKSGKMLHLSGRTQMVHSVRRILPSGFQKRREIARFRAPGGYRAPPRPGEAKRAPEPFLHDLLAGKRDMYLVL
jgi:hypothetical protein